MSASCIVVFDGCCSLCNGWVRFIRRRDPGGVLHFIPAQSLEGQTILQGYGISPDRLETLILIHNQKLLTRSEAVLEIFRHLKGVWKWLFWLKLIPRPLRDMIYRSISRHRYRWFGRQAGCALPQRNRPGGYPLPPHT